MSEDNNLKIVLVLMVKNEAKIIERCITQTLPIIDAVCVCDTGSTDDTIEVVRETCKKYNLVNRVFQFPFTNFGESRSKSFFCAKEFINNDLKWDENNTYGFLLDADMVLKFGEDFQKTSLSNKYDHYRIIQVQGKNEYYNIRFILMAREWKCIGKTHEVWVNKTPIQDMATITGKNFIWIDDVSDGGCKDDKFERDERLLLQGLIEEPELYTRYCFYLGQTYYSTQKYEKAIEYYGKRASVKDDFKEEIWFSIYMISICYNFLKDYKNCEKYALEAFQYYPCRSEPLLELVIMFKELKNYEKAWKYLNTGIKIKMPEKQILYFQDKIYLYEFYYQKSHLLFLTNPENLEDIRDCLCRMLNYKDLSRDELINILSALKHTACPLSNNVLATDVKIDNHNIKFLSENVFLDLEKFSIGFLNSEKEKHVLEKNTIPLVVDDNIIFINFEKLKKNLPNFISNHFLPTYNNFVLYKKIFLFLYNPNTFLYMFLILDEKCELKSFVPPFFITEDNQTILDVRPSIDDNKIIFLTENGKMYKFKNYDILSKQMSIHSFLQPLLQ